MPFLKFLSFPVAAFLLGTAAIAQPAREVEPAASSTTVIDACVNKQDGLTRIVKEKKDCFRGETFATWNIQGPVGLTGPQGAPGIPGAQGPAGPKGTPGTPGTPGATGPAGPAGAPGVAGAPGTPGAIGPAGAIGPIGPAGVAGVPGAVGPAGPAGAPGVAGAPGAPGAPGATGPAGPAGAIGPIGPAGVAGAPGTPGALGPIGPVGATGATGAFGPAGPTGAAGPAGVAGPTGPKGDPGAQGPTGPAGTIPANLTALSGQLSPNGIADLGATRFIYAASNPLCQVGDIVLSVNGYGQGALPADGRQLPINGNTAIFSLIGTNFGGNGTSNFNLPDLRAFAPKGLQYSICVNGIFPSEL